MTTKNTKAGVPDVMTIDEVAHYLQVGDRTAYKLAAEGVIPALKVAGSWRFPKAAVDRWLEAEALKNIAPASEKVEKVQSNGAL